jgi:hypothetical protein
MATVIDMSAAFPFSSAQGMFAQAVLPFENSLMEGLFRFAAF